MCVNCGSTTETLARCTYCQVEIDLPGVGKNLSSRVLINLQFSGSTLWPNLNSLVATSYKFGVQWARNRTGLDNAGTLSLYGKVTSKRTGQKVGVTTLLVVPMPIWVE